jgi:peptidoglycan hydrolase CwlO-like protein
MVVNVENQLTQTTLDIQHQKGMNEQTNVLLEEIKKEVETKEKELENLQSDLHHTMFEVHRKQGTVDSLRKKLEQLTAKSGVRINHIICSNVQSSLYKIFVTV